tara:strand:+ start:175 stop:432 length:258 start_codon:yes stop_codon:yes gene_type:complete
MNSEDFYSRLKDQIEQITTGTDTLNAEAMSYLRLAISNLFERLDLVSREEFDAQTAVLKRSREKIDRLEQQLRELEEFVSTKDID